MAETKGAPPKKGDSTRVAGSKYVYTSNLINFGLANTHENSSFWPET